MLPVEQRAERLQSETMCNSHFLNFLPPNQIIFLLCQDKLDAELDAKILSAFEDDDEAPRCPRLTWRLQVSVCEGNTGRRSGALVSAAVAGAFLEISLLRRMQRTSTCVSAVLAVFFPLKFLSSWRI